MAVSHHGASGVRRVLTAAGNMFLCALVVVGGLVAKVAIQFEACSVCHEFGHVEMGENLLATTVLCGRVVLHVEKAGRG